MTVFAQQIKSLREKTGGGIMEVKKALEEAQGSETKAKAILIKMGRENAAKRQDKETSAGQVFSYIHSGGQIGSLVVLMSETDFVAKSTDFQKLGRELAMQVAAMGPKNLKELLGQPHIRDVKKTVNDLILEYSAKFKEKITVKALERFAVK
jgi:elongation factor Ts